MLDLPCCRERRPAGARGLTAAQVVRIHSWDKLIPNFIWVRIGFPRLQIERKLALFISVTDLMMLKK